MDFKEFKEFYFKYNRCPNDAFSNTRKNPLNERQLESKYEKYLKQENYKEEKREKDFEKMKERLINKEIEEDALWSSVRDRVMKRDMYSCRFETILNDKEYEEYEKYAPRYLREVIDPAHVFGKGAYPHMKYDVDNIVCLARAVHSCLDQNRSPINGKPITLEEKIGWWKRIVGISEYEKLRVKSIKGESK